jgi:hypothetical protein
MSNTDSLFHGNLGNAKRLTLNLASKFRIKQVAAVLTILALCVFNTACMQTTAWLLDGAPPESKDAKYPSITVNVVDVETGVPIEGAVILLQWTTTGFAYGPSTSNYKIVEGMSDNKGKIAIPLVRKLRVHPPYVTVFKRGYVGWRHNRIFPGYEKRQFFTLRDGYTFRLERFRKEYSIKEHKDFVRSVYASGAVGGGVFSKAMRGCAGVAQLKNPGGIVPARREVYQKRQEYLSKRKKFVVPRRGRGKQAKLNDPRIKKEIDSLYISCSNRTEPLLILTRVPVTNSKLRTNLPNAIRAVIREWEAPEQREAIECRMRASPTSSIDTGSAIGMHTRSRVYLPLEALIGHFGPIVIPVLSQALAEASGVYRQRLIKTLAYANDKTIVDMIIEDYSSGEDERKISLIRSMGILGDEKFTTVLLDALLNEDQYTRAAAEDAIDRLDHQAMQVFVLGLQHKNQYVRAASFRQLAYYPRAHSDETIVELLSLLKDTEPETRKYVVEILGIIDEESVVLDIAEMIKDTNLEVQKSAIYALSLKTSAVAKETLLTTYKEGNEALYLETAKALLQHGVPLDNLLYVYPQCW